MGCLIGHESLLGVTAASLSARPAGGSSQRDCPDIAAEQREEPAEDAATGRSQKLPIVLSWPIRRRETLSIMTATAGTSPHSSPGHAGNSLPFLITAPEQAMPVRAFLPQNRELIRLTLREQGAVLLRGFEVGGVAGFDDVVRIVSGQPLSYVERSSPRSLVQGQIYTSTDYPPTEEIFLHNENSYQADWPLTLFFHCLQAPATLGATPLADVRRVYAAIDPEVRDEFARRGWMVVRNFSEGMGVPWQQAFNTEDRHQVAEYCRSSGIEPEWTATGLRTRVRRPAVHQHPVTGETVWFNHLTFFHVSTLGPELSAGLREIYAEKDLPTNTYYGDGSRIPDEVVDHLRACYRQASRRFDWQLQDVLLVDNMLTAHGREPFTGARKIVVAMAEPYSQQLTAS
jgi:alpha-ketoglutarate-dependent taurine dioxygenase